MIKFEMVFILMYQGLYPLGLRLSSSPKNLIIYLVCVHPSVVPRASHVTSAQPLGAFPCPTPSPHCLCGCLACCIYLSSRRKRRTERPAASFSYESSISLEGAQALGRGCSQTPSHSLAAWWRQSLQGTARLSEPVFPAVLQLLSARRQSCTLPVSLQCLSSLR